MNTRRPYVLTIAGFDPSAGAGILADVKTMEQCHVYGVGIIAANTFQNDVHFESVDWMSFTKIKKQIDLQFERFRFPVAKIGLVKDVKTLLKICKLLKSHNPYIQIIWDPIIAASAGFVFHEKFDESDFLTILDYCHLITPNKNEFGFLFPNQELFEIGRSLCHILVKGGHQEGSYSNDILYTDEDEFVFEQEKVEITEKHGTGCILSSAIAAGIAKRMSLQDACKMAKDYTLERILSNQTKLAFHA